VTAYSISPGSTLVFSADGGIWETITFKQGDFADPQAASAEEVAKVIDRADHLEASAAEDGGVVVATASTGANATLDFDLGRSTAAGALGLTPGSATARGSGLVAARLVSLAREPFPLPVGAEMAVRRNGTRRKVQFTQGFEPGAARATDVVTILNEKLRGVARTTRDRRVMLRGRGVGPDSAVEVLPAEEGAPADAAAILGFVGAAAISHPHRSDPAKTVLKTGGPRVRAVSLSASPIELQLPTGPSTIPPRAEIPLTPIEAADAQLRRLVARGAIRLAGGIHE
jgi:hypothetical protein